MWHMLLRPGPGPERPRGSVNSVDLENVLRDIDPDGANLMHGWLLLLVILHNGAVGARECRWSVMADISIPEDSADGIARQVAAPAHPVIGGAIGENHVERNLVDAGILASRSPSTTTAYRTSCSARRSRRLRRTAKPDKIQKKFGRL